MPGIIDERRRSILLAAAACGVPGSARSAARDFDPWQLPANAGHRLASLGGDR